MNITAVITFFLFVMVTLVITWWAAARTKTRSEFYTAGESISGTQNGLAIAGDIMSAAALLGTSGLAFSVGYDSFYYIIGPILGFAMIMLLIVEPLRNLGKYTFTDVLAYRLERRPVRIMAASSTLVVCIAYLLAQIVGAGLLISSLFNLSYSIAVVLVGILMVCYVSFGGMLATTWVQITKAVLLLVSVTILLVGVFSAFDFSISQLINSAIEQHPKGSLLMQPGGVIKDPISAVSLMLAFVLGTAGLPHLLMRFFTVKDVKEARKSVVVSTLCIGYFSAIVFFIGMGAIALLYSRPEFFNSDGGLLGGSNMAAIHLSSVIGGDVFLGFISAVAFATILAVVSGLTISAVSAVSHDLYANVFRYGKCTDKQEMKVAKVATIVIGVIAILLSLLAKNQNITILVTLAMAIAASANFPALVLSIHWRGLTTRGTMWGVYVGLCSATVLVILGPLVWVDILGFDQAVFPYHYPTLFSVVASFAAAGLFSITDRSERAQSERSRFAHQQVQSELGMGKA